MRDAAANIIQPVYGGDGWDAKYLETVRLPVLRMDDEAVAAAYPTLPPAVHARVLTMRDALQAARLMYPDSTLDDAFRFPANAERVLRRDKGGAAATVHDILEFEDECGDRIAFRLHLLLVLLGTTPSREVSLAALVTLRRKVWRAQVASGEAVGPLASTSIGEPTTQMTLNVSCFCFCSLLHAAHTNSPLHLSPPRRFTLPAWRTNPSRWVCPG